MGLVPMLVFEEVLPGVLGIVIPPDILSLLELLLAALLLLELFLLHFLLAFLSHLKTSCMVFSAYDTYRVP